MCFKTSQLVLGNDQCNGPVHLELHVHMPTLVLCVCIVCVCVFCVSAVSVDGLPTLTVGKPLCVCVCVYVCA